MISTILLEQTKTNAFALLQSKGGKIRGGLSFADDIDLPHFEVLNSDTIIAGDTNINLFKILEKEAFSDFFDTVISHSFYPKITLPTRFSTHNGTLIDNFFCKLSKSTIDTIPDILIKTFSDHQPYFICLNTISYEAPPPKYIKVTTQSYESISNFAIEIINADILERLNKKSSLDPNTNYNNIT